MTGTIKNRREFLFLYDVSYANPNGDPNDENKPRIDEGTGKNIVTDVRLKRTIRDYLKDFKGEEIFVREIIYDEEGHIQDAKLRARDFVDVREDISDQEKEQILRFKKGEKISKSSIQLIKNNIRCNLKQKAIDIRLFGATVPLEFKNSIKTSVTFTGPVQFNMGQSLHKVKPEFIKGTGAFASESGKEQKTFREEWILPYSLIAFHGIANENAAKDTGLTEEDIEKLKEAMWYGTKNLITRSKNGQMPRLLIEIIYKEGAISHIGDIHRFVKLQTEKADEEIRDPGDYVLNIDKLLEALEEEADKIEKVLYKKDRSLKLNRELSSQKVTFEEMDL